MRTNEDVQADAILQVLEAVHRQERQDPGEGLRQRKKRQLRQRISNTATALFLAHGFEAVTIAQIATACDVSEQTVFNYFPTKESMFLDRSERAADEMAAAVRQRTSVPLADAIVAALLDRASVDAWQGVDEAKALEFFRLFGAAVERSPTLTAAQNGDLAQLITVVAAALAERVGADADDPEVQIAAVIISGLARTRVHATFRHLQSTTSIAALDASVRDDVLRAARVVAPTLEAFDNQPRRLEPVDLLEAHPR